jgi:hypothetical protein
VATGTPNRHQSVGSVGWLESGLDVGHHGQEDACVNDDDRRAFGVNVDRLDAAILAFLCQLARQQRSAARDG